MATAGPLGWRASAVLTVQLQRLHPDLPAAQKTSHTQDGTAMSGKPSHSLEDTEMPQIRI